MIPNRYICIHGHFYQPPRENPWLEIVEVQDSAYPFHDWNDRITDECYAPNASSRLLDDKHKLKGIINNYSKISFNIGPTLLSWIEKHKPSLYKDILNADTQSLKLFDGHGSAIAQAYNHIILPLANKNDKITQIIWGIKDFEHRFKRMPEALWLAETAVNLETLDIMAEYGIKYTILSPYQAKKYRKLAYGAVWRDANGGNIDPTRPYLQKLPSGREIVIFFYDGPISRSAAFEGSLRDGKEFAKKLVSAFVDGREHTQIVNIATDGETYGHHHRFGEMALTYALHYIEQEKLAKITNYGAFLSIYPPVYEVEIHENSAWSCSHGVERWRSNCGCNTGGRANWNQNWRTPLREAFDWLRDIVNIEFNKLAFLYFKDPWLARNAYISVILNRNKDTQELFLLEYGIKKFNDNEKIIALKFMELQRHSMLMYTSCGWFFDELSGIETVQCIQYAGRVVQLAQNIMSFNFDLEKEFINKLSLAKSNIPEYQDGAYIYINMVKPAMINFINVGAHYAVSSIFEPDKVEINLYNYEIIRKHFEKKDAGKERLVRGKILVRCLTTLESMELSFVAVNFGEHNINAGVKVFDSEENYFNFSKILFTIFESADFSSIILLINAHFENSIFSLKSLFKDEQRQVMKKMLKRTFNDLEGMYTNLYDEHYTLMKFMINMNVHIPQTFKHITEFVSKRKMANVLEQEDINIEELNTIIQEAKKWGYEFEKGRLEYLFQKHAEKMMINIINRPHSSQNISILINFLELINSLHININLWKIQNDYFNLHKEILPYFIKNLQLDNSSTEIIEQFKLLGKKLGIAVDK